MSGGKFHANHGRDHSPDGLDPANAGKWHKCGDPGEPALNLTGMCWFRLIVGRKGLSDSLNSLPNVRQTLEVIIKVSNGADGDVIATLPPGYFDFADGQNIPGHGHDSAGAYKAWYLNGSTGDLVIGPLP